MTPFPDLLRMVIWSVPGALVWLAALLFALVRWQRHPAVSLLVALASVLFIVGGLGGSLAFSWAVQQSMSGGPELFTLINLARLVLNVVASVLLLLAVFGWRPDWQYRPAPFERSLPPSQPERPGDDQPEAIRRA